MVHFKCLHVLPLVFVDWRGKKVCCAAQSTNMKINISFYQLLTLLAVSLFVKHL